MRSRSAGAIPRKTSAQVPVGPHAALQYCHRISARASALRASRIEKKERPPSEAALRHEEDVDEAADQDGRPGYPEPEE